MSELVCDFCGRPRSQVRTLIAGPSCAICDACVRLCEEAMGPSEPRGPTDPGVLVRALDERVVGATRAKRALAAALAQRDHDPHGRAPRVLLVGPSGTGKSTLARALAELARCAAYVGDASRLSETGYVGDDVEHLVYGVLRAADHHVPACEAGLLVIDDLETLRAAPPISAALRDVSGASVQRELGRLLEGDPLYVPPSGGPRHPQQPPIRVDSRRIVVVGVLRWDGAPVGDLGQLELRDALCREGYLEALVWRFDRVVALERLGPAALLALLDAPYGPLARALTTAAAAGVAVELDVDARAALVEAASACADGGWALGRPLRRMLEEVLLEPARTRRFGAAAVRRWL